MRNAPFSRLILPLFLIVLTGQPAAAGFLDNVIKKAKQATESVVNESVDEQVDQALETGGKETGPAAEGGSDGTPSQAGTVGSGTGDYPTSTRTMVLAVVKMAPDIFQELTDHGQKEFLTTLYPEEKEILSNKFSWHKKKDQLIQRAVAESKDAASVFEVAPWIDNSTHVGQANMERPNHLRFVFGQYDFEREGFTVSIPKITIPWTRLSGNKGPVPYRIVGIGPKKDYWVGMPVDEAEQFYERVGTSNLWAHYRFRLTKVVTAADGEEHPEYKKYERMLNKGGVLAERALAEMEPVIDVVIESNRLDLYALDKIIDNNTPVIPKDDLHFVTTVQLEGT